jgi:hypothetical protein
MTTTDLRRPSTSSHPVYQLAGDDFRERVLHRMDLCNELLEQDLALPPWPWSGLVARIRELLCSR